MLVILAGKSIQVMIYKVSDGIEQESDINNQKKAKWKSQEETIKNEETIAESGRIFIRNLAYTTTEDDIQHLFSKFGEINKNFATFYF